MNILTKASLAAHVLRWRLSWDRHNSHEPSAVPGNPKFMNAWDAAGLIPDGAAVGVAGFAASMRSSILYWAVRERFLATGQPKGLTVLTLGGSGGRGRIPGTLEEWDVPGLLKTFITGHSETYKSLLRAADNGHLEFHCLPLGQLALLFGGLEHGETSRLTETGVGTFIDPRCGRGTPVTGDYPQLVAVEDGLLRYSIPKIDVALFNAPAADRKGNIYSKRCAVLEETIPLSRAARQNGGRVIANVGSLVKEGYGEVLLPAEEVDAIVVWKGAEQVASVPHRRYWDFFTLESKRPMRDGIRRARFVNHMLGITPRRKPIDNAMARLAASVFVEHARKGDYVDIGIGLPEEVSRLLFESGALDDITLLNESGVFGGLPAPGVFFGAAVNPSEIVSATEAFQRIYARLDAAILGALEIDSHGNNNVSWRGPGAINYVGPGGFIDLTCCARTILFCCAWGTGTDIRIEGGKVRIVNPGKSKLVDQVNEVTFSGPEALRHGKLVFYVTPLGAFRLTERGMELYRVMPGVDIQKDIIGGCAMKVVLPESGEVPIVSKAIVTGEGFQLRFAQ